MTSYIAALDHPSLHDQIRPFVNRLCAEDRRFGTANRNNPKPYPSLIRKVSDPSRRRFGVVENAQLIGMASLAADGEVAMVIDPRRRGHGHGTLLLAHVLTTAERQSHPRLFMQTSRRSVPLARLGARLGWTSVEHRHGRVELICNLPVDCAG